MAALQSNTTSVDKASAAPQSSPGPASRGRGENFGSTAAACPAKRLRRRNLSLAAAVVTCPCHLPIAAALLSGTAAGALLSEYFGVALVLFLAVFAVSLRAALKLTR